MDPIADPSLFLAETALNWSFLTFIAFFAEWNQFTYLLSDWSDLRRVVYTDYVETKRVLRLLTGCVPHVGYLG